METEIGDPKASWKKKKKVLCFLRLSKREFPWKFFLQVGSEEEPTAVRASDDVPDGVVESDEQNEAASLVSLADDAAQKVDGRLVTVRGIQSRWTMRSRESLGM